MKWFALILLSALLVVGMAACDNSETPVNIGTDGNSVGPPETITQSGQLPGPILPDPEDATGMMEIHMTPTEFHEFLMRALPLNDGSIKKGETSPQLIPTSWIVNNQKILDRAYKDIGKNVWLQCKPWASKVVLDALGVTLPSTAPTASGWYWSYSPRVSSWCGLVEYASPGQILQMWLGANKPHTAIICGKSATGMYWVDSNYCATNTVCFHWISYKDFYAVTNGYFSINQVI